MKNKSPKILMVIIATTFSGLFLTGCNKTAPLASTSTIISNEITPEAILSKEIDPTNLSKEEKTTFLTTYLFTETGLGPSNKKDESASLLLLKHLSVEEIFDILSSRNYENTSIQTWRSAFITKKNAEVYPKTIRELSEFELSEFINKMNKFIEKKREKQSTHESSIRSSCGIYSFNFNAYQSSSYNRNCYFVAEAGNDPTKPDCDYMTCFSGYGEGLYGNTSIMRSIISSNSPWGFGGYNAIIIRKIRNRTYVLFGSNRVNFNLSLHGIFNSKKYLKEHVKLKV